MNIRELPYDRAGAYSLLNIAWGKGVAPQDHYDWLAELEKQGNVLFTVNVDTGWPMGFGMTSGDIAKSFNVVNDDVFKDKDSFLKKKSCYTLNTNCTQSIWEFLYSYPYKFDFMTCYRFLEHVPFDRVIEFIYACSQALNVGGMIDIIVPNYMILAKMILGESENSDLINDVNRNIILTTELVNEPGCPHASIWTPQRAEYFFTLEKRFKIIDMTEQFEFDGRNIYMRFTVQRIS